MLGQCLDAKDGNRMPTAGQQQQLGGDRAAHQLDSRRASGTLPFQLNEICGQWAKKATNGHKLLAHTRPQLAVSGERLVAVIGMFYQISVELQNK